VQPVTHRGLQADFEKKALFSAAQKVKHLTPTIGSEILGLDLRQLSDTQKDELYAPIDNRCMHSSDVH
jgi:sulfonate dioxygenase